MVPCDTLSSLIAFDGGRIWAKLSVWEVGGFLVGVEPMIEGWLTWSSSRDSLCVRGDSVPITLQH